MAVEVLLLVRGADAGVDDLFLFFVTFVIAEESDDVVSEVEALSAGEALAGDFSLFCPSPEARIGDVIFLADVLGRHVHGYSCHALFSCDRNDANEKKEGSQRYGHDKSTESSLLFFSRYEHRIENLYPSKIRNGKVTILSILQNL